MIKFLRDWTKADNEAQVWESGPSIDSNKIAPYVLRVGAQLYERASLGITELGFEDQFDIEYEHRQDLNITYSKLYTKDEKQKFTWDLGGGELKVKAAMNKWWQDRIIKMNKDLDNGY